MTKQEYEKAVDTLNAWAKAYYDEDEPLASDEEYDALYHAVLDYEQANPSEFSIFSPTKPRGRYCKRGL